MAATELDVAAVERDALRILELLCRQPSISAEGTQLAETADLVEELLAGAGFETRQLAADGSPPAVYGDLPGTGDFTLLLYNHYDVQPVDPLDLWETPPFEPTLRDGKLFARGASDNKAELAVRLATIRALREARGDLPVRIRWIVEGEEEVGSTHFDEIVRRNVDLLRADACLWEGCGALADGRPEVCLGFKGTLAVRLDLEVLSGDAHSGLAAALPSAAWRLLRAVASLRDAGGRVRIAGFQDVVRKPTEEERAVIAVQSDSIEAELHEAYGFDEFVDGLTGPALRERFIFEPTCNLAGFHSGYGGPAVKTVLPARASAWLDFRVVPDQRPEDVLGQLRAHLDGEGYSAVEITPLVLAQPASTPLDHPFVQRVTRVAERVSNRAPSIELRSPATLPIVASLQRHVGVPGVAAPDNPVYSGSAAHAPNEHVRLEDFEFAVRFTLALLDELGGG